MDEFLKVAIGQGIFCGLFVWLLMDTRKDTKERENQYQNIIEKNQKTIENNQNIIQELTAKFRVVENIEKDVEDIKNQILK